MIRTARTANISRIHWAPATLMALLLFGAWHLEGTDPTFLRHSVAGIDPRPDDLTSDAAGVSYQPIFGAGDPQANQLKSVARYGLLTAAPGGSSASRPTTRRSPQRELLAEAGTKI